LFERYRSFASESEKEGITTNLQQTEEWLYEDGDNETENVYAGKIEELKKVIKLSFSLLVILVITCFKLFSHFALSTFSKISIIRTFLTYLINLEMCHHSVCPSVDLMRIWQIAKIVCQWYANKRTNET
jgi:uncharacterized membrane protein